MKQKPTIYEKDKNEMVRAEFIRRLFQRSNEQVPVPAPAREDRQLLPPAVLFDNPYQQLPAALFDIPSERALPPALKVIFYFK